MAEHVLNPFPAEVERATLQTILARRIRGDLFPANLFSDPAWDILLLLFLARLRQQRMTLLELTAETAVPQITAGRWLDALQRYALVTRKTDPGDTSRTFVELSARGLEAMHQWVQRCLESPSGPDDRITDLLTRMRGDIR